MTLADRWLLPDGIEELLPPRARQMEQMRRRLLDLFDSWGYSLVMTPLAEHLESLLTGVGPDLDLKTFKVTDQISGHTLGVRADITPQVARIDAHRLRTEGPSRLCYCGSVLHTRPSNMLASRNPMQTGAELYGHSGIDSDVEVIALMLNAFDALNIKEPITLDLGDIRIFSELMEYAGLDKGQQDRLRNMLERKALPEIAAFVDALTVSAPVKEMLRALPELTGDVAVLERARQLFADVPGIIAALDYLAAVAKRIEARHSSVDIYFDLGELRGYHYHTGIVFAAYSPKSGQALAKGGRYDEIGRDFGRARPATGFSADLKLLLDTAEASEEQPQIVTAPAGEEAELLSAIAALRQQGYRVVQRLEGEAEPANCAGRLVSEAGNWVVKDC